MEAALKAGFRAEGISMEELLWAREVGFRFEDMVYNGPVPLVERHLEGQAIHVVFADSLESFVRLASSGRWWRRTSACACDRSM